MERAKKRLSMLVYLAPLLFVIYEAIKVYLIMPFPGSQRSNTLQLAFYLQRWTSIFAILLLALMLIGAWASGKSKKWWLQLIVLVFCLVMGFFIRTTIRADEMFKSPKTLIMAERKDNKVDTNAMVIGIEKDGFAAAFPIRFVAYHHIILYHLNNTDVMVTYCDVCHSGRIYDPVVKNVPEKFRLVGMDHFNAMFEDQLTKSWWRQESGECVAGPRKGEKMKEFLSRQMTVGEFYKQFPNGKVMQPDPAFVSKYDMTGSFEQGRDKSDLTRTDTLPWKEKSLVVGVTIGSLSKAYDWNELIKQQLINDVLANQKIVVVSPNGKSFSVFLNHMGSDFTWDGEMLRCGDDSFDINGTNLSDPTKSLVRIHAYQEFWHSWKTFHPNTAIYPEAKVE